MRGGSRFALMASFVLALLCIGEVANAQGCYGSKGLFGGMRARREARQAAKACASQSSGFSSFQSFESHSSTGIGFAAPAFGFSQSYQAACSSGGTCAMPQAQVQMQVPLPSPQSPPPPAKSLPTPQIPTKSPLGKIDNGEVAPPPNPYSFLTAPPAPPIAYEPPVKLATLVVLR